MSTSSIKNLNVEVGKDGVEVGISAGKISWLLNNVGDDDSVVLLNFEGDLVGLEACSSVVEGGVLWTESSKEFWSELEVVRLVTLAAAKKSIIKHLLAGFLVLFVEEESILKGVVMFRLAEQTTFRQGDDGVRAFKGVLSEIDGAKRIRVLDIALKIQGCFFKLRFVKLDVLEVTVPEVLAEGVSIVLDATKGTGC